MITPAVGANPYRLEFRGQTGTLKNPEETDRDIQSADLVWNNAKGTKGSILIDGKNVYVKNDVSMPEVHLEGTSMLRAASYITVTRLSVTDSSRMISTKGTVTLNDLYVEGTGQLEEADPQAAVIRAPGAMKIGNISGTGAVVLDTSFTAVNKAGQSSVTQLTISGKIDGVQVGILPRLYDLGAKAWHVMTEEDAG